MADPALCVHKVSSRSSLVSMLCVTTADTLLGVTTLHPRPKARIMIAHFNTNTMELDVKRSKFEQFNGFEAKEDKGNTGGRARPHNFETKGTFSSDGSIRFFK